MATPIQRHIVLIEDNPYDAQLVTRAIYKNISAITVETCETLNAGIGAIRESQCQYLITDLNLPDGECTEIIEAAQKTVPEIQMLAVSGFIDPQTGKRLLEAGVLNCFNKDDILNDSTDFIHAIRKMLKQSESVESNSSRELQEENV